MKKTLLLLSALHLNLAGAQSFKKLEKYLFTHPSPGMKTEALVIEKDAKEVYSRFEHGSENSRHLLWSMSKSLMSLLFGVAEGKGFINRNDSIYKYFTGEIDAFPKRKREALKKIKLKHLLQMSSGLAWKELYEEDPFSSHVVKMLYLKATGSIPRYVLQTPIKGPPGERFYYSSGDTNLVAGALSRALPKKLKNTYPWEWLFGPMEMDGIFEQDGEGNFVGSSYGYLKTKDLVKLGQMIIDKGLYQGRRIVPAEYVGFATDLSESMRRRGCLEDSYMTYGAQFWLNHKCPGGKRPFERVTDKLVMMLGHGGQSVFIFPEKKIVAVRIARDKEKAMDKEKYAALILEALNEN